MAQPLDLMAIDLSGTHLIEASAGTGKTYTIASLFLRLLLEQKIEVENILVVTYTVPATDELKNRIRARLRQAREDFAQGSSHDPFMARLMERVGNEAHTIGVLDGALARFDETAISTIHGFCQRMLKEMAFETASPFETELVTDQSDLVASAAEDFFRAHITAHSVPEFIAFCRNRGVSPEWFMRLSAKQNLSARIIPEGEGHADTDSMEARIGAYRLAFEGLAAAWPQAKLEVERLVCDTDVIKQNILKLSRIPGYLEEIDRFLAMGPVMLPDAGCLSRFTADAVAKATKKGLTVPEHEAFALCGALLRASTELEAAMEGTLTGLKAAFLSFLVHDLERRKATYGLVHYDDLLLKVHRAILAPGGDALAAAVGHRFKAALIDEFQDTDLLQYEIFTRCFAASTLFFIGDPKQAVYSFRGADVFTYARAASAVNEADKHTLIHNWRSEPDLIQALNAVFSHAAEPFVFDWIGFEPALPADKPERKTLTGLEDGPLMVWYLDQGEETGLTVERANAEVCRATAFEISRLLNLAGADAVEIGNVRIKPSDMAVLVRTNKEARMVRDALSAALIPCVLYSDENVFFSREALEMEVLLAALFEPQQEGLVRAALMTRIIGLDAADIDVLAFDEAAWEGWVALFRSWHDLWARLGFTPMIRTLLDAQGVRRRLLGIEAGERSLTNVLHLAELLGRAQAMEKLGMQGLRKWLAERRDPALPISDEYQLRLESDEDAVKIMTVHKSKGLEFPIVFCPFAWGAPRQERGEGVVFHDEGSNPVLDLGSVDMDDHRARSAREGLAESVRLLYVALTRAKNRCYVALAAVKKAEGSAMAHLMKGHNGSDLQQGLGELIERSAGRAQVKLLPREEPHVFHGVGSSGAEPAQRIFRGEIDRRWGMASYTSFIKGLHKGSDAADRDTLLQPVKEEVSKKEERAKDIFSFPRGARAGTLLHAVFEKLDFTADEDIVRAEVEETLHNNGFDTAWADILTGMVRKVLSADLAGVRLGLVKRDQRLTELEFLFPLKPLTPADLDEALKGCMPGGIPVPGPRFTFDPVKGFLRGFMDLVFNHEGRYYLIDWKSNHLGDKVEDYHPHALLNSMVKDGYVLQYHLYCVALHRYLSNRLEGYAYKEHFGGVFYVYLRGVDPARGSEYGIFRAKPEKETIDQLSRALMDYEQ